MPSDAVKFSPKSPRWILRGNRGSKGLFERRYPMASTRTTLGALEEIADFLASGPSPEELLQFRPSPQTQARAEELLDGLKDGCLSAEERRELDQFEQAERLMRLVKARIQAGKARRP
jgi:hypothetical protein